MTDRELMQQALDAIEALHVAALNVTVSWETWLRGLEAVEALRERLAQQEQEPFEYWNAVDGWVTVTPNEVLDGRAKQRMLQAAMRTVQEQYRDDPEVMFARGWDAGFNARTCGPNRKDQEPLTEEELKILFGRTPTRRTLFIVRAVEQVHNIGEKE